MRIRLIGLVLSAAALLGACGPGGRGPAVYVGKGASALERLAAAELRRYIYLTSGSLPAIVEISSLRDLGRRGIVVAARGRSAFLQADAGGVPDVPEPAALESLDPEGYLLKTIGRGRHLLVAGGSPLGALYGAYAVAEKLGVRFYLDGDVVPDARVPFAVPDLDETAKPLFKVRGIQPFHDFPEGPDWWNEDTYKAVLGQLPKLRMNFFGLHTYPERNPNAEPGVWIGRPGDFGRDGTVRFSYPSSWQNTARSNPGSHNWGYAPEATGSFHFGAAGLFESDAYGPEIMAGLTPEPKDLDGSNALFARAGAMLRGAFELARRLGVRTCIGTETPLTVPAAVKDHLRSIGLDPADPKVVKELYRGIFGRIMAAFPIDVYWFWTNEGWTWSDASDKEIQAVTGDLALALEAATEVRAPFGLATCGWVLGPPSRRTLFDEVLPKFVAASCINREVGKAPVDPSFARIAGRSKWAIPWLEDDPSLTSPQLWAGRMRRDAVDALRYGCDGLLGIHWRTRILSANASALAHAAWDQRWNTVPMDFASAAGPVYGRFVRVADKIVCPAGQEDIYRDVRDRVLGYRLDVPDGTYAVTLMLIEPEVGRKGGRVFDVSIQGVRLAEKVDIFDRAGKAKAYDLTFRDIAVAGGRLAIDLGDRIHYPALAGLIVAGRTAAGEDFVKKINCGGPAAAGFESDWPETPRFSPVEDFYADWARNQFGQGAAAEIGALFARIDGRHPVPVTWTTGPGGIVPDAKPWAETEKAYGFVDELAALRPKVRGAGSLERFDYWLANLRYMREIARYCSIWGRYNAALEEVKRAGGADRARLAGEKLLPVRVEMVGSLREIFRHLLATVSNTGELGTIANWEQHLMPDSIEKPGDELAKLLGRDLPPEAALPKDYAGPARIFVPSVRTAVEAGETLALKVIILAAQAPEGPALHWRELGRGDWKTVPLARVARGVFRVEIPAPATDIEYYLSARAGGADVVFPATAPALNQTVVVIPGTIE